MRCQDHRKWADAITLLATAVEFQRKHSATPRWRENGNDHRTRRTIAAVDDACLGKSKCGRDRIVRIAGYAGQLGEDAGRVSVCQYRPQGAPRRIGCPQDETDRIEYPHRVLEHGFHLVWLPGATQSRAQVRHR